MCVATSAASIDLPCKTVISIPIWLFNTFNEKCLFYMADTPAPPWQNHMNFTFLILCYFATAFTFLSVYVQLMVSISLSY